MKKCPDCKQEIDKYAIACEYCGKLVPETKKAVPTLGAGSAPRGKKPKAPPPAKP